MVPSFICCVFFVLVIISPVIGKRTCKPSIDLEPLDNSCYNYGDYFTIKYDAKCCEEDLEVYICQILPFKECFYLDCLSPKDYYFKIDIVDPFVIGNTYCIEITDTKHEVVVNTGLILVNEKACYNGKCIELAFPYTSIKPCYKTGETFSFQYKAVCFSYFSKVLVEKCDVNGCFEVRWISNFQSDTFTITLDSSFTPGLYFFRFSLEGKQIFLSQSFFITNGDCSLCQGIIVTPSATESCYKIGTEITFTYESSCYTPGATFRAITCVRDPYSCADIATGLPIEGGEFKTIMVPPKYGVNTNVNILFLGDLAGNAGLYITPQFIVSTRGCYEL